MQLFRSNFPDGLPGIGLLLLRAAVGLKLIRYAVSCTTIQAFPHGMWTACLFVFLISLSFLIGFLTQLAGGLFVFVAVSIELFHPPWSQSITSLMNFDATVIAIALCLLGSGAFSLDAHFFGRRKIIIPRMVNS